MNKLCFTWDLHKAQENSKKHGISFEEARSVFYDEHAVEFYDDEHVEWEDRFLLLGLSAKLRLLLICHCHREKEGVIRIISARKATKSESRHYWR
ncbi:MAG TPA: BrnT family toxin [Candidatus Hydrogenedentes bacterium]|nr:BrnT family toxin [Candidatus Hydrogenedentota bacterium]